MTEVHVPPGGSVVLLPGGPVVVSSSARRRCCWCCSSCWSSSWCWHARAAAAQELAREPIEQVLPVVDVGVHRNPDDDLAGVGVDDTQLAGDVIAVEAEIAFHRGPGDAGVGDVGRRIGQTTVLEVDLVLARARNASPLSTQVGSRRWISRPA
jgi:hypothetical protein